MKQLFYTPEGVRDVYGNECEKKIYLKKKLQQVFHLFGYQDIETPTFEYFDVFSQQVGTTPSRELYKFFDREGNTLVLRPDFTPSIARAAAMYFPKEEFPVRLCYSGNTFINNSNYQGRLKESTQMGVELLGDETVDADAEILAMAVELLKKTGLKEFQISVGQVDFFKSLMKEANLPDEAISQLRQRISNKNYFGVEELLESYELSPKLFDALKAMPQLFGSVEVLDRARALTDNKDALKALDRLEKIYEVLKIYGCERYISFDLGMLSKYRYYTGIIFQGYTYGSGEALIKGGRYNHLLEHFGHPAPAIGFGLVMEQVLSALDRQNIEIPSAKSKILIVYPHESRKLAITISASWRSHQMNVQCMPAENGKQAEDYISYGKQLQFTELVYPVCESQIRVLNLYTDEEKIVEYKSFI